MRRGGISYDQLTNLRQRYGTSGITGQSSYLGDAIANRYLVNQIIADVGVDAAMPATQAARVKSFVTEALAAKDAMPTLPAWQNSLVSSARTKLGGRTVASSSWPKHSTLGSKIAGKIVPAGVSPWTVGIDLAMGLYTGVKSGQSVGVSIVKTAVNTALWNAAAPVMWGITGAQLIGAGVQSWYNYSNNRRAWYRAQHLPFGGVQYKDTAQAATMRQAAVQAIQASKMNARTALGTEARLYSRQAANAPWGSHLT